jgi:hypothetical protein
MVIKTVVHSRASKRSALRSLPPLKKVVFGRSFEIEINAWEDSSKVDLSETIWVLI